VTESEKRLDWHRGVMWIYVVIGVVLLYFVPYLVCTLCGRYTTTRVYMGGPGPTTAGNFNEVAWQSWTPYGFDDSRFEGLNVLYRPVMMADQELWHPTIGDHP
jgi:hypothetical protein